MSDQTHNLGLSYVAPSQAQKHVTVNEALRRLDAVVQLSVVSATTAAQPENPADGAVYLLPTSPTGAAWGAFTAGRLAYYRDGAWEQLTPKEGWLAYVCDADELRAFNGSNWGGPSLQNLALLGINATADATNKFSVSSAALLFNHAGAGVQAKLNKAAAADTASFLFQDGFSGRAEFGLIGDDNFTLKVSTDGAAWTNALVVDRTTGRVTTALQVSATDRLLGRASAGAGAHEEIVCTAAGRALIDDANAAAQRATLGLSSAAPAAVTLISGTLGFDASGAPVLVPSRIRLSATQIIWVTGSIGNDATGAATGGATFANGFATIQAAIDYAQRAFDAGTTLIQLYPQGGPYTAPITISGTMPGVIWINGSGGVAEITTTNAARAVTVSNNARLLIGNCKIKTIGSGIGIYADSGAQVNLTAGMDFDACVNGHLDASGGALIVQTAPYTISGGGASHFHARNLGMIAVSLPITVTNTPAFSAYFAGVSFGFIEAINATFSGAATGPRFVCHYNGTIRTAVNAASSNPNLFPGSSAGSTDRHGLYDDVGKSPRRVLVAANKLAAFQVVIPAYHRIDAITLLENGAAAVSGGVRIGTTDGGGDVVAATPLAQNGLVDATLLKRLFSVSADTTLYVTAASAWNGANVTLAVLYDRLN